MDIEKSVQFMEQIAKDDTHGYDQINRYGPDYDCSSLVAAALIDGGFEVSKYSWTGNLAQQLKLCGFFECTKPYIRGDIHLKSGKHVCMSVSTTSIAEASINENGKVSGGKTGDQTGKEIAIKPYYEYSGGWDYHFRYYDNKVTEANLESIAQDVIKGLYGDNPVRKSLIERLGLDYDKVQARVNSILDSKHEADLGKVARQVIRGEYGNGSERREKLEKAGYNYEVVQALVNEMIKE